MDTILVLYATREGQTRKIAEHVGEWFRAHGRPAQVVDVANPPESLDLAGYRAAVLAASVHAGRHEPASAKPVAGALQYTHYGRIVRFIMKQISKKQGGSTDTSRDHEYTDWAALDRFVEALASDGFRAPAPAGGN